MGQVKKDLTGIVVVAALGFLLSWELWTVYNSVPADTISENVWRAIEGRPFIPFLTGFLMGHFFWQKKG